jgi:hypothetical protein
VETQPKHSCSVLRSFSNRRGPGVARGLTAAVCVPLLLGAVSMLSCDDNELAEQVEQCLSESLAQGSRFNWIQGQWRFTGTGEREDCDDDSLNTDSLNLGSASVRVHQQRNFLFLEGTKAGFALSGVVGNRCIRIKTVEQTKSGKTISYDFPAWFVGNSTFRGEFRGSGPGHCSSKGDFTVFATLDPIPKNAGNNPAPADAGVGQQQLCADCKDACDQIDPEYSSACQSGCDNYVCKTSVAEAGADADAADALDARTERTDGPAEDAADAPADSPENDAEESGSDGESDAPLDVEGDGEAGDGAIEDADSAIDGGMTEDAADSGDAADGRKGDAAEAGRSDAGQDAAEDVEADSSDIEYDFWSGTPADLRDAAKSAGACSTRPGRAGGAANLAAVLAIVCGAGALARRRRRRA